MFKLLIFIVLIVAIAVLTPLGQQLKARVITYVNPTAAEREVINNLQNKLSTISKTINKSDFQKLKSPEQIKELNKMLEETQSIAAKAGEIAEKKRYYRRYQQYHPKIHSRRYARAGRLPDSQFLGPQKGRVNLLYPHRNIILLLHNFCN